MLRAVKWNKIFALQSSQGRISRKIWLPSFTKKLVVLRKTGKNRHVLGLKSGQKPMKEQSYHKLEARFGLSMPKNPFNNLLLDHINEFEFFLIFWVHILSYVPLLQEGTTAEFPALGSSHNRSHNCKMFILFIASNKPQCFTVLAIKDN